MPDTPAPPDPSEARDDEEPSPESFMAADENGEATWQPGLGPLTRVVAWIILIMILLGTLAMVITVLG